MVEVNRDNLNAITDVMLHKMQFCAQQRFQVNFLLDAKMDWFIEEFSQQLAIKVCAHVAEEKLKEVSVRYPSDWIEAIKERFSPKWLLKKFPVVYTTETLKASVLYPNISFPKEKHYIRMAKFNGDWRI